MPRLSTLLLTAATATCADAFVSPAPLRASGAAPRLRLGAGKAVMSTKPDKQEASSWQERAEALANPFVPPQDKPALLSDLLGMREDIAASVSKVISRESKPEEELLGPLGRRQLRAQETVARQLRDDILPSAREQIEELRARARDPDARPDPRELQRRVQGLVTDQLDDLTASGKPPALPEPQQLARDLAQEVRNVFQSTPEGLETPPYAVAAAYAEFEVREYEGFTVARTETAGGGMGAANRTFAEGRGFNTLAGFLFGDNEGDVAMAMTTPVFQEKGEGAEVMSFVIPREREGDVPAPRDEAVEIAEMPPARYAVREFAGFVTDKEVEYQRQELLKSIEAEGLSVEEGSKVTVAQYNPPYTLPTSRRNEVLIQISGKEPSYGTLTEKEFKDWGKEEEGLGKQEEEEKEEKEGSDAEMRVEAAVAEEAEVKAEAEVVEEAEKEEDKEQDLTEEEGEKEEGKGGSSKK